MSLELLACQDGMVAWWYPGGRTLLGSTSGDCEQCAPPSDVLFAGVLGACWYHTPLLWDK